MADVQAAPAPVKDVSDRSAQQGNQSWNDGAARAIWGKPPVPGQKTDASPATQQADAANDNQSAKAAPGDAPASANKDATDKSAKTTGPKEATTNANDQSRNNNANDASQPTLKQQDAPQLVAEVPQEAMMPTAQATDSTSGTQQKQYSLPDGSTGVSEQTNDATNKHYNLKLSVADNQSIINKAQSAFDDEINRQIAALPGAAMQGIGDGLGSLAQMGVFVGGTVLNELQIAGDIGVTAIDAAVVPSFVAGDLNRLGDDSNALAAKGDAVMDGIGKAWAPADQDCFDIGFKGEYNRLLTDPVNAAFQAYDKYSSQSAPDQVRQLSDATTQVVAPVAGEGMLGAASGLARKEAVGAAATAADGADVTMGAAFKANLSELLDKLKTAVEEFSGGADVEENQVKGIKYGEDPKEFQNRIERANKLKALDPIKEPTDEWRSRVRELTSGLTEAQQDFLVKHNVPVVPERHVIDVPGCEGYEHLLAATFRNVETKELKIHLAEMVWKNEEEGWVPNPDAEFSIEHEFGHAFNEVASHTLISNEPWFKESIKAEIDSLSDDTLRTLDIDRAGFMKAGKYAEKVRDEIFSDLYAHTTGLRSNNPYSRLVKSSFPKTLEQMELNPKILQ
ncbi:MAG TPA: hypothetical protein V6C69_03060 [Trichormus sp.]|jgi:hypothetical protein